MSNPSRTSRRALLAGAAVAVVANNARAQPSDDPAQLLAIMERYAAGLRWGTADALAALYTSDGVFIRDNLPAAAGTEAVRAAYRQVFATLKLDVAFEIKETEVVGDMAWLRATSRGRIKTSGKRRRGDGVVQRRRHLPAHADGLEDPLLHVRCKQGSGHAAVKRCPTNATPSSWATGATPSIASGQSCRRARASASCPT